MTKHNNQRSQYGTTPDQPTKAPPRISAVTDRATSGVSGGTSRGTQSGVGKKMKG